MEWDFREGKTASAYLKDSPGDPQMIAKDIGLSGLIPLSIMERSRRKDQIDIISLLVISTAGLDLAVEKKRGGGERKESHES